jgi:hypothetical protein
VSSWKGDIDHQIGSLRRIWENGDEILLFRHFSNVSDGRTITHADYDII